MNEQRKTRDVAGILHFLTREQMAEEIVRLDAILASRATRLAAAPDQPIETAPKDGTEILAWREDCGWFLATWTCVNDLRTTSDKDRDELDEESLFSYDWFGGDSECTFRCDGSEAPTRWMPLPPAPDAAHAAASPEADERAALIDKCRQTAERHKQRADDCGALARDVLAALASAPAGAGEGARKLWLWKNFVDGKPEYWAFDNPYPINLEDGDPQTLGQPCGYAIFKPSRDGSHGRTEKQVLWEMASVRRAALAGEPAVAADEGRACETEDDCTQMPWCRIRGKCQRAASQDEQQGKQGGSQ